MKVLHLFIEQIRDLQKPGDDKIEIPSGARISAAAHDYIKDNNLKIHYIQEKQEVSQSKSDKEPVKKVESPEVQKPVDLSIKENIRAVTASLGKTEDDLDEKALDDVVNRVVARVKELKSVGQPQSVTTKPAKKIDEPVDGDDLIVCRCEEISQGEIKDAIKKGMHSVHGIRRVTRAGMGLCQGQTCGTLVAQMLSREAGIPAADIIPATARGPVRPVPLEVFANSKE